jgi:vanillate O-demethylase ferredoxin subunit
MTMSEVLQVRVKAVCYEAEGILSFDLRPLPPLRALPPFTAGAHIDLQLPNGMIRSYSLLNASSEVHRYVVGVNKDPKSRGGSRFLHENVRAGDVITISHPRNNFELDETAGHSVFIAGGIGITPLWSMIQRLEQSGASWELHYATRTRRNAAFLEQLQALPDAASRLHLTFDAEPGGVMLDLGNVVATVASDAHFYCCGPLPMLEAFERATALRSPRFVHVEYFAAKEKPDTAGGFTVELAKSGRVVSVPAGKTILDTLLDLGISAPYSCQEGVCGTCEVKVLEGIPDHRDLVLTAAERASNETMFICCSGSKTPRLVIDF